MKTKREESIQDILTSFEALTYIILCQRKLLERFMKGGNDQENEALIIAIREKENEIDGYEVLNVMLLSGISMVEKSLLSFINNDNEYAICTIKNDEIVDDMNRKLLKNSISRSRVSDKTKEMLLSYIDLKNIITKLERITDHATNIAEGSIYSIQGTDIRHSGLNSNMTIPDENK